MNNKSKQLFWLKPYFLYSRFDNNKNFNMKLVALKGKSRLWFKIVNVLLLWFMDSNSEFNKLYYFTKYLS